MAFISSRSQCVKHHWLLHSIIRYWFYLLLWIYDKFHAEKENDKLELPICFEHYHLYFDFNLKHEFKYVSNNLKNQNKMGQSVIFRLVILCPVLSI